MEKKNKKCEKEYVRFWRKDCGPEMNYDVCCLYHRDGELLLCDGCPSAFHYTCLGLSSLPKEKLWFCPCCCCDVCGSIETSGNIKLMTCEQCQRRFCSHQCSRVTSALKSLLGCKIAVGDEGDLVWTLMRAPNEDEHYADEQISKLGSAVKILHQGSGRDLVEELIFKKDDVGVGRGFYTVMIEKNNEPITWLQRRGMCRVLMDELEKQMYRRGVCILVLPAAADVMTTWTQRFGFSVMEKWERLELVKHGMLHFAATVMCHKSLMERGHSGESNLTE
ncbi:hypothetical protein Bca4012_072973 [Brassica carinata]